MSTGGYTVTGITVYVRVCPQIDPASAPISRKASAILDKKSSFASSYALKNSFISSKTRKSSLALAADVEKCVVTTDEKTIRLVRNASAARDGDKEYTFDKVFPEDSTQEELCISVHDHVLEVVNGYNATVICHGASKSGKSYTMTGTKDARGIIPHGIKSVFSQIEKIKSQDPDLYFYTEVGYVELYNNNFRDLLQNYGSLGPVREDDDESVVVINEVGELDSLFDTPSAAPNSARKAARNSNGSTGGGPWQAEGDAKIQVHESKNLGVFLSGSPTLRVPVSSANEVFQLYSKGQKLRSSRVTDSGHVSSRSHAILILYVESRSFAGDAAGGLPAGSPDHRASFSSSQTLPSGPAAGLRMSKLTFVDMAGADRLEISGAVGDTLVESQNINLSLAAFGDVLFALSKNAAARAKQQKGSQHVPYLNSKLTQLLKESLGGNAKTVLITTIHSTSDYSKVTETSLQYATWASAVRGKVVRNDLNIGERWIQETDPEILRLRKLLEERSREFAKLRLAQLTRPPATAVAGPASATSPLTYGAGRGSFAGASPAAAPGASPAAAPAADNSPLAKLQKRLTETSSHSMSVMAVTESKTSFHHESSLKAKITDLELENQELKEDLARKSRQSTDLSVSLKKSLELIQQQNKALTDQLTDVSHEKDAQIDALNKQLVAMQAELAARNGHRNPEEVDSALNAANAELERAKKSAWDRYLTITQQQERINQLEAALEEQNSKYERARRELEEATSAQTQDLQASLEEQRRALEHERSSLHAALKAAEEHVYEQEQHLQEQHASQAYQISALKDKCEALKAELVGKETELAGARRAVQEGQEQLAKESRLLSAECLKSSDLQASLDMHIALVASLKMKMTTLQGQATEEAERRVSQERVNRELEAEITDLRDSLRKVQSDYSASGADLQARLIEAEGELQKLRAALSSKEASVQALEARLATQGELMASERQAALQDVQELQDQLREQLEAHQHQTAKFLARNSEAEALEEALRATRAQLEAVSAEAAKTAASQEQMLAAEKSRSAELTQALQRAQKLHESSVTQFTDDLLAVNVKLQTSENLCDTLNLTVEENEKQIAFLQSKISEIMAGSEAEVFASQDQLSALDAELAEVRKALDVELAKNRELEDDRRALRADVTAREAEKQRLLEQKQTLEDNLAREVQKRKAEMEAAQETRREALAASKADFDEYVRLSELKVADMTRELAAADERFEETVAAYKDHIQADQNSIRELTAALEDKAVEIQVLQAQLVQLRSDRERDAERAKQNAADAADAAAELVDALAAQKKKYAALEAENRALAAELLEKQAELDRLALGADVARADMQAALDAQVAHTASLRLKIDVLQGALDEETAIRQNREQRVSDLELINADLERSAQRAAHAYEAEMEKLKEQLDQGAADIAARVAALQGKDAALDAASKRVEDLEGQCDSLSAMLAAARQRIASLEAALAEAERAAESKDIELQEALRAGAVVPRLTAEVATLKASLAAKEQALVTEIQRYTAEEAALEEQVAALKESVEDGIAALAQAKAENTADRADLLAQIDGLRIDVSELENAVAVKDASLAILMEKLAAQEQRTAVEVGARISELAAYEARTSELQDTIVELQRTLRKAAEDGGLREGAIGAELQASKDRIAEMSRLLDAADQELEATRELLESTRQRADAEATARQEEGSAAGALAGELRAQVADLQERLGAALDAHSADSNAMAKQAEENLRALAALSRELDQKKDELRQALRQVEALQEQCASAAAVYDAKVNALESDLAAALGENAELKEALSKARKMHDQAEAAFAAESDADQAKIDELAAALAAAEAKLAEQGEALREALEKANQEYELRTEETVTYEEHRTFMQSQVEELTVRLTTAVESGAATAADLGSRLEEALAAKDEAQAALQEATESLRNALVTIAELESKLSDQEAAWGAATSALEEQLADLLSEKAELQERLKKTRKMHDMAEATFAAESEADQEKIEELKAQSADLAAQLDAAQAQLAEAQATLENSVPFGAYEEEIQSLKAAHVADVERLEANIEELRAETAITAAAASGREAALRSELAGLVAALADKEAAAETLGRDLAARLKQIEGLQADVNAREADIRVLQAHIAAAEKIAREDAEAARSALEDERLKSEDLSRCNAQLAEAREADKAALAEQIDAALSMNASLRSELSASIERSEHLQSSLASRDADIASLQDQLMSATTAGAAAAAALREQLQAKALEVNQLQAAIAELEKAARDAELWEQELEAALSLLKEKLASSELSYEALEKKLIAAVNARTAEGEANAAKIAALQEENVELADALAVAQAEAARIAAELAAARASYAADLEALKSEIQDRDVRIAELGALLAAKDREIAALNEKIAAEELKAAGLAADLQDRETTIGELTDQLSQLEGDLLAEHAALAQKTVECSDLSGRCDSLEDEVARRAAEIAELQRLLAESLNSGAELKQALRERESELAAARTDLAELQRQLEEQAAIIDVLKVKLAEQEELHTAKESVLKAEIAELQRALDESRRENGKLTEAEAAAQKRCEALERQLDDLQALLETVRADLQRQLDEARDSLAAKSSQLAAAEVQVARLTGDIAELKSQLDAANAAIDKRDAECKALADKLRDSEAQLSSARSEAAVMGSALKESQESCDRLQQQLADAQFETSDLRAQLAEGVDALNESRASAATFAAQLEDALARAEELQRMFEEQVALVEVLKLKLAEQEKLHTDKESALNAEIAELQRALDESRCENGKLTEAEAAAQKRCEALERQLDDLQVLLDTVRADLERQLATSKDTCMNLVTELAAAEEERESLREKVSELTAELEAYAESMQLRQMENKVLAQRLADCEAQLSESRAEVTAQAAAIAELKALVDDLREKLAAGKAEVRTLTDQLRQASEAVAAAQRDADAAQARVQELHRLLEEQAAILEVLKVKLAEQEKLHAAEESALKAEIAELQRTLDESRRENGKLTEAEAAAQKRCEALERQLDDLQALLETVRAELQRQLENARAAFDAKSAELDAAEREVARLDARVGDLESQLDAAQSAGAERQQEIAALTKALAYAEAQLEDARAAQASLQDSVDQLRAETQLLQAQLSDAEAEKGSLARQLARSEEAREEERREAKRAAADLEEALARAEELQRMFEEQVALVEVLKVKLAEQEKLHTDKESTLNAEIAELQRALAEARASSDEQLCARDAAEKRCASMQLRIDDLQALFETVKSDLERELAASREKCAKAAEALAAQELDAQRIRDQVSDLTAVNAAVSVAAQERLLELKAMAERLAVAEERLVDCQADLARQVGETAAARAECAGLAEKLQTSVQRIAELNEVLREAEQARSGLEQRLSEMHASGEEARARNEVLQRMFEEQVALVDVLRLKLSEQEGLSGAEVSHLRAEIAELKSAIADLRDRNAGLVDGAAETEQRCTDLERQLDDLRSLHSTLVADLRRQLEESRSRASALADELSSAKGEVDSLRARVGDLDAVNHSVAVAAQDRLLELTAAQERLADANTLVVQLRSQCEDLQAELALAERFKTALREEIGERDSEMAALESQLAEVQGQLDVAIDSADAWKKRVDELQRMFEEQVALVEVLKVKLGERDERKEKETQELLARNAAMQSQVDDLQAAQRKLQDSCMCAEERCAALEAQLADLQALQDTLVSDLRRQLESSRSEGDAATALLADTEAEMRRLKEAMSDLQAANHAVAVAAQDRLLEANAAKARLSDAVEQLLEMKAELDGKAEQIAAVEKLQQAAQEALQQNEQQRAELQRMLLDAKHSCALSAEEAAKRTLETKAALARVEELQRMFEEQAALVDVLKVKLAEQEELHGSEVSDLKQKILDLCASLQDTQAQNAQLLRKNVDSQNQIDALNEAVVSTDAKASVLATSLHAATAEVTALKMQLEDITAVSAAKLLEAEEKLNAAAALNSTQAVNIADLNLQRASLAAELQEAAAEVIALTEEKRQLTEHYLAAEEALKAEMVALKARNVDLLAGVDEQAALVATLRMKLKGLQEEAEACAHQLVHETAALEQCQAELSAANANLVSVQTACDTKVAGMMESIAQTQKVQELMAAQLSEQMEKVTVLEGEVKAKGETLAEQQAEIARLEAELAQLRDEQAAALSAADDRMGEAQSQLAALRADHAAQEAYIAEIEAQRKAFKAELAAKAEEIERLEQQLEKLVDEAKAHAAHVTKLRVQLAAAQARLEEEGHKRIHQLAVHEQKLAELEVAKVASDHALQRYEAKVAALTAELSAFGNKKSERMSI